MIFILSILSSSICDRTIELSDMNRFDSISTSEKETICFKNTRAFSLLLFKHIKDYVIVGNKANEKQKLAGFYFGTSESGVIELISTKSSSFSFFSTFFLSKCQNITVSTLENDQITFTNSGKLPACYFHTHKNSTYAISMDADDDSILVGLKNEMKFSGKINDFIRSSSETFLWFPSQPSENVNDKPTPKATVTVNMPNKFENHHGFKISLQSDQFTPIIIERRNHHHNDHHHDDKDNNHQDNNNAGTNYSYEYPPKFNYNNVYQNSTIIFTSLLSVIITFVAVFLAGILFIRLFFCVCLQKRQNRGQYIPPSASDIPPVEIRRQLPTSANQVQPQSLQAIPVQNPQQYQQPYVFYPNLLQNQFSQQQPQFNQQQQFLQQQQFVQQPQYAQQQFVQPQQQQQHPLQQVVYI